MATRLWGKLQLSFTPQRRSERIYFLVRACSSARWKRRCYRHLCLVETAPGPNVHRHTLESYQGRGESRVASLPAPTGISTLHVFIASLRVCEFAPLSGLPLRPPWSGWVHFLSGRQKIPSSARCFGHTAMFKPSSSKWPEWARIKYFSSRILVWDTLTALRWALISLWHDVSGKYSVTPGERLDTSQPLFEKVTNEQESEAILHSARCCN